MTSTTLAPYLADLADRIDPAQEQANRRAWQAFALEGARQEVFTPPPRTPAPPAIDWPDVHINDAQDDLDLMVLDQLRGVSDILAEGSGAPLLVRCNYGTGILPSLFGCERYLMPRPTATLPTVRPLGNRDAIAAAIAAGPPEPRTHLGARVFEAADRFQEVFQQIPAIGENVRLYHPDLQGPIDVVELLWGSDMFLAFYDGPDLLTEAVELVTETYIRFMRDWLATVTPREPGVAWHWSFCHAGTLMIRNDSLMNLSPEIYTRFVRPADQRLFDVFGGGGIHFCGRGDHFIEPMSEMAGLHLVDLSQVELNDMSKVLRHTVDRGIRLRLHGPQALADVQRGGHDLRGLVAF